MKLIVTGPKFILSYEYVPWYQHQKDVVGGGEEEKGCVIRTELEAIFGEILQNITTHIWKIQIFPNLTLPVTN